MKYTKISAIALIAALLNPIAKADLVDQFNAARARTTDAVETQTCINQTAPIFFDLGKQVIKSYVAEAAALFGSVYDSEQGSPETRNFMWYSVFKLRDGTLCSLDMENNLITIASGYRPQVQVDKAECVDKNLKLHKLKLISAHRDVLCGP